MKGQVPDMSSVAKAVQLPEDLQAFAEERVRAGKNASVAEVVCDALEAQKRASLREAINEAAAELDAGLGVESSVEEVMAEARALAGL